MMWLGLSNPTLNSVCQEMEIKTLGYILAIKIRAGRVSTNTSMYYFFGRVF